MLHRYCKQFLDYCRLADFSITSIQTLAAQIASVKKITYYCQLYEKHEIIFVPFIIISDYLFFVIY